MAISVGLGLLIQKFDSHTQYSHQHATAAEVDEFSDREWQPYAASNAHWHHHQLAPYESQVITTLSLEPITLAKVDSLRTEVIEIAASDWQQPLQRHLVTSLSRPLDLYHSVDGNGRVFFGELPNPILFMLLGALLLGQVILWLFTTIRWRTMATVAVAGPMLIVSPLLPIVATGALLTLVAALPLNKQWAIPWVGVAVLVGLMVPQQWQAWSSFAFALPLLCYHLLSRQSHWYQQVTWLALMVLALELPVRSDISIIYALAAIAIWQLCHIIRPLVKLSAHSSQLEQKKQQLSSADQKQYSSLQQQIDSLESKNRMLHEKTWVDPLTGLRNRLFFNEQYQAEVARSNREQTTLSLLILDLDFFKNVNDQHGHPVGDEVLRQVAKRLYYSLRRPADALCRIGGEEFAILLPQTNKQGAEHVANTLLKKVAEKPIIYQQQELYVTASIGCATLVQQVALPDMELFNRADSALYHAKARGRNRCESFDGEEQMEHFAIRRG
ncbi:GGDEF domain-containing protein [Ferrimonas lipolytica]|uniref:diguanylate cyclase n=1 Tax=Ferrimonas lipolytica TaxID=2724191 RepID=A0A6H1UFW5_9GAMM|nr:GGDEF domain-containing protein [Ferrimonas lipolytica]QIZ77519.1 GGDEF domain-containing protein [Ferrimonas lipolytica]